MLNVLSVVFCADTYESFQCICLCVLLYVHVNVGVCESGVVCACTLVCGVCVHACV